MSSTTRGPYWGGPRVGLRARSLLARAPKRLGSVVAENPRLPPFPVRRGRIKPLKEFDELETVSSPLRRVRTVHPDDALLFAIVWHGAGAGPEPSARFAYPVLTHSVRYQGMLITVIRLSPWNRSRAFNAAARWL